MIDLKKYVELMESVNPWSDTLLKNPEWSHRGDFIYAKTLLQWILNPDENTPDCIYLGKNKETNKSMLPLPLDLTKSDIKKANILLNKISSKSIEDFDDIFGKYGLQWKRINKMQLSGVGSSGNLGNQFELDFIAEFNENYNKEIKDIAKYNTVKTITHVGQSNNKRPYHFNPDGSITAGKPGSYNIGNVVSDVTLDTDKGEVYLSLKYGDTVSLSNIGCIGRNSNQIIPRSWYNSGDELPKNGKALLDMLGIDAEKYRNVFKGRENTSNTTKVKKANYDTEDITDKLKNNDNFIKFVHSNIGYGYIMVHKYKNGKVEYIDLLSEDKLKTLASHVLQANVKYPDNAKRVEVHVDMDGIVLYFVLRPSDGGPVPTRVHCGYKFK